MILEAKTKKELINEIESVIKILEKEQKITTLTLNNYQEWRNEFQNLVNFSLYRANINDYMDELFTMIEKYSLEYISFLLKKESCLKNLIVFLKKHLELLIEKNVRAIEDESYNTISNYEAILGSVLNAFNLYETMNSL